MSASKIVCRVGQAKNDKGDIIVTTKSGGKGTSTVSFKLLKPEKIGIVSCDFSLKNKLKLGFVSVFPDESEWEKQKQKNKNQDFMPK